MEGRQTNLRNDYRDERGKWVGVFHEIGHRVDRLAGRLSENMEFENTIKDEFESIVSSYQKEYNLTKKVAYKEIGKAIEAPEFHSVSDLFGGMSQNQCVGGYSHEQPGYWEKTGRLGNEAFAHFFEATCRRDRVTISILRQTFPKSYKMFEDMMEALE